MTLRMEDREGIKDSIACVHSSSSEINWVLCGRPKGTVDVLKLLGKGSGGIDEVNVHSHQEDMQVMYGLVGLKDSAHFVFITWFNKILGQRLTSYSKEIAVFFMPYHSWVHIDLTTNTSLRDILEKQQLLYSENYSKSLPQSINV